MHSTYPALSIILNLIILTVIR